MLFEVQLYCGFILSFPEAIWFQADRFK